MVRAFQKTLLPVLSGKNPRPCLDRSLESFLQRGRGIWVVKCVDLQVLDLPLELTSAVVQASWVRSLRLRGGLARYSRGLFRFHIPEKGLITRGCEFTPVQLGQVYQLVTFARWPERFE